MIVTGLSTLQTLLRPAQMLYFLISNLKYFFFIGRPAHRGKLDWPVWPLRTWTVVPGAFRVERLHPSWTSNNSNGTVIRLGIGFDIKAHENILLRAQSAGYWCLWWAMYLNSIGTSIAFFWKELLLFFLNKVCGLKSWWPAKRNLRKVSNEI